MDIADFHWMVEMVSSLDVGLVVLDREYRIQFWNTFMSLYSGLKPQKVLERTLFEFFPELETGWFRHKVESVFLLNTRAFTTWEQRPWLFCFKNHRPLTGTIANMYQNTTVVPIAGLSGRVEHVAIMVYNVTTTAANKLALTAVNSELQKLSRSDQLTGLNNRAYWEECVVSEFRRYQRSRHPTTLVMFDIDHFKKVNDTHGHLAGDAVIRATAQVLRKTMRETDIAGRYGGEEFAVVLTGTGATDATRFAERLRTAIASNPVQHHATTIAYTISLGIAELEQGIAEHRQWIERSDRALYHSKQNGRNRHTLYEQTTG